MNNLIEMGGMVAFFMVWGWIIKTFLDHRRRVRLLQLQAELHGRVLDKLDNAPELIEYLKSEPTGRLLEPAPERMTVAARVLAPTQLGIVLAAGGFGLLSLDRLGLAAGDAEALGSAQSALVIGNLGVAIGLGLLAAGGAAWYLSRSGALGGESRGDLFDDLSK